MDDAAATPAEEAPADGEVEATAPPAAHAETGVAMYGEFPFNHRLRAEALAEAGKEEDPDGLVSRELIADAAARLEADRKAEAEARPPVSTRMEREALDEIAGREGLNPADYSNKGDLVRAIEAGRQPAGSGQASGDPPPPPASGGEIDTRED